MRLDFLRYPNILGSDFGYTIQVGRQRSISNAAFYGIIMATIHRIPEMVRRHHEGKAPSCHFYGISAA
jgi:hypothetical protein